MPPWLRPTTKTIEHHDDDYAMLPHSHEMLHFYPSLLLVCFPPLHPLLIIIHIHMLLLWLHNASSTSTPSRLLFWCWFMMMMVFVRSFVFLPFALLDETYVDFVGWKYWLILSKRGRKLGECALMLMHLSWQWVFFYTFIVIIISSNVFAHSFHAWRTIGGKCNIRRIYRRRTEGDMLIYIRVQVLYVLSEKVLVPGMHASCVPCTFHPSSSSRSLSLHLFCLLTSLPF
jgi:hypothetical protein